MPKISDQALQQTISVVKTLGSCAVIGAEAGFLTSGVEGAKIGAVAGLFVGAGLLIYFAHQERESAKGRSFPVYPFALAE